jgi:hypothetical protein
MIQETLCDANKMNWGKDPGFPSCASVKVLRNGSLENGRALLVNLPPTTEIGPQCDVVGVQHYVLEGEYRMDGERFGPGVYRYLPPHAMMNRMWTDSGVTVLMVFDPIGHHNGEGTETKT